MLSDRSCSIKQTTAKGNRGPERTRRGSGNMGLRTGLEPSLSIPDIMVQGRPAWLGWRYECVSRELQVRPEREAKPRIKTKTSYTEYIIETATEVNRVSNLESGLGH